MLVFICQCIVNINVIDSKIEWNEGHLKWKHIQKSMLISNNYKSNNKYIYIYRLFRRKKKQHNL